MADTTLDPDQVDPSSDNQQVNFDLSAIEIDATAEPVTATDDTGADTPKGVGYEDRVVAFVDILGFKEIIALSAKEPEWVARIFYALDVRKDEWATMYAADVGLSRTADDFADRFHSFSDCVVMSVGSDIEEIGLLVYGMFKFCRQLLVQGFASRGGIAQGQLYHHDEAKSAPTKISAPSMVFGPAFVDAYQFESAHADGPRVILQTKVWKKIDEYCIAEPETKLAKFLRTHIQRADDGPAFIDLFADFGTSEFYETDRDLSQEMQKIHDHICHMLDSSNDKPHHFKKNALLAKEFNRAILRAGQDALCIPQSKLPSRR